VKSATSASWQRGDVRMTVDANADGEPDDIGDLRDECNAAPAIPFFAHAYFPYFTLEGEVPRRPEPLAD
jgi:hypothetical protein